MEHRVGSRVPANLEADIYQNGKKLGVFLVKDIGASGLRVERHGQPLRTDDFLQVVIKPHNGAVRQHCRTSALVVWADDSRAGLLRADQNTAFTQLLRELPEPFADPNLPKRQRKLPQRIDNVITIGQSSCSQCFTHRVCLVGRMSADKSNELKSLVRQRKPLRRGERLFIQGDEFYSLYLVRSGSFKSSVTDDSGDYQVNGFYFPGDILGLDGAESGRHRYEVKALETASVCAFPFHMIDAMSGRRQSSLCRELICAVSGIALRDSRLLMVLGRMHAEQRLASFLLEISKQTSAGAEAAQEFKLSMARYDIASYLGLAVETVSRLFRRFQEIGLIHASRNHVCILDRTSLERMVGAEHRFSA